VYFLVKLTAISQALIGLAVVTAALTLCFTIIYAVKWDVEGKEAVKGWLPKMKKFVIATLVFGFIAVAVPNTKEAAVIWLLPKIVNNEQVQEVPNKALKLLNKRMDEWLEENLRLEDKKE
jgi:hypothetical protein